MDVWTEEKQVENVVDGFVDLRCSVGVLGKLLRAKTAKLTGGAGANEIAGARGDEVCSQLREGGAVNFCELHLQKDLLRTHRTKGQDVDHVLGISGRQLTGALGHILGGNVT